LLTAIITGLGTTSFAEISVSPEGATPGERATIRGSGFGETPGAESAVVLSGLRIEADSWGEEQIDFTVPEDGVTGPLYVRISDVDTSDSAHFRVLRSVGTMEPSGLKLADTGLQGAGTLVEADGAFLYSVTGLDTLTTYDIRQFPPLDTGNYEVDYHVQSRVYFPQRLADLKVYEGHLYCVGDFGLRIYRCQDLQADESPLATASVAGGAYYSADARWKGEPINGLLVALSEYRPQTGSDLLRVPLYRFLPDKGELEPLGEYSRVECEGSPNCSQERQFDVAIDPDHPKIYLGASRQIWYELLPRGTLYEFGIGADLELDITHTQEFGPDRLPWNLEADHSRLWVGFCSTASLDNARFMAYEAWSDPGFSSVKTIHTNSAIPTIARLNIIDEGAIAVIDGNDGHMWDIPAFPFNVGILDTVEPCEGDDCFLTADDPDTGKSADWALDVGGAPDPPESEYDGTLFVSDEWAGVLLFPYRKNPLTFFEFPGAPMDPGTGDPTQYKFMHDHHIPTGCWAGRIHISEDRAYVAARGGGPWSVARADVSDAAQWKWVRWNWSPDSTDKPQPNPASSLCTRQYPEGNYIVTRSHSKAFGWGGDIKVILYKETEYGIEKLAESAKINPSPNTGASDTIWPEQDLVYVTTATEGVHALVVDPGDRPPPGDLPESAPRDPGITIHSNVIAAGGITRAVCMRWHDPGSELLVGFDLGGGFYRYDVDYPGDIENPGMPPDRDHPDLPIEISGDTALACLQGKDAVELDITEAGIIAVSTNDGLAIFSIDAFDEEPQPEWPQIKVDTSTWSHAWGPGPSVGDGGFGDVSFDRELPEYLYVLNNGLWCLRIDPEQLNDPYVVGYYPATDGFNASKDYGGVGLKAWGDPDLFTLHQPSSVRADGDTIFVTGWAGKVQKLHRWLDCTDGDGDGFAREGGVCGPVDCDDAEAAVHPGAAEICDNGIDDDCDGLTDTDPECGEPTCFIAITATGGRLARYNGRGGGS